jgi:peptide/nickel transport system substrate-binding protein
VASAEYRFAVPICSILSQVEASGKDGTIQDQIFSVAYKSDADWNHTKWQRPRFDQLLIRARGETDPAVRKLLYGTLARTLRDDGGAIIPMFNDFIDAMSSRLGGYVQDPGGEISNGFAAIRCWLKPVGA